PGLLGIAFHPVYSTNRYFYVFYTTEQTPLRTIIARYTTSPTNPDSALKSSEFIIMTIPRDYPYNNAGKLAFGPDNYLYMGIGYGGLGGDPENIAQNRTSLLGKILRINIDSSSGGNNYSIPPTNPFYGNTQGWRQEIFTWGMRNTWKFSFDNLTNRIWAGDPGQGQWEEIDIIQNGKNYGWRMWEGYSCYSPPCDTAGMTFPIWVYSHADGCVIVGGYVYRGTNIPGLVGKYIYADHCSGKIWALYWDGINPPTNQLLLSANFFISSFGVDQNNNIYACQYSTSGKIYRLSSEPIGIEPVSNEIPSKFSLSQKYPNPFNPKTIINFQLPMFNYVQLIIFDILGREIATLVNEQLKPGTYEVDWNAANYP
ncbi:MAG: PQQ-dependent sugar dehydrogenase, partial [Ignavibacteria bacterium]